MTYASYEDEKGPKIIMVGGGSQAPIILEVL